MTFLNGVFASYRCAFEKVTIKLAHNAFGVTFSQLGISQHEHQIQGQARYAIEK